MPTRSILLTEDDDTQREIITDILSASGYAVQAAASGEEALQKLGAGTFDLLLTDLRMSGMDGLEVLHQLRENPATLSLPVAVFTSSKDEEDLLKSRKLHASAFVRKPVNGEEFLRAVGSLGLFWGICHRSGGQT